MTSTKRTVKISNDSVPKTLPVVNDRIITIPAELAARMIADAAKILNPDRKIRVEVKK